MDEPYSAVCGIMVPYLSRDICNGNMDAVMKVAVYFFQVFFCLFCLSDLLDVCLIFIENISKNIRMLLKCLLYLQVRVFKNRD